MSNLEELKKHREDVLRRLKRAESADNSYEHNDHVLTGLESELEKTEEQIVEMEMK